MPLPWKQIHLYSNLKVAFRIWGWSLVRIGKLLWGIHLPIKVEAPIAGTLSTMVPYQRGEREGIIVYKRSFFPSNIETWPSVERFVIDSFQMTLSGLFWHFFKTNYDVKITNKSTLHIAFFFQFCFCLCWMDEVDTRIRWLLHSPSQTPYKWFILLRE